nr:hypothetical protein [Micromonospora sp. DSM 115978]
VLDRVPAQARYVESYGDVDLTMRWRTDDRCTLDLLVSSEATAWRTWRDAERRARDFARLHRRAADSAHAAHSAWQRAVYDLVEQHPSFRGVHDAASRAAADGAAPAGGEPARHSAPGDPPTRRVPSRTESAAQAMLRRIDQGRGRDRDAPQVEPVFDPDRDGYEEALAAWHAAADRDGIDVPLSPGEEAVELTTDGGAAEADPDGGR